MLMDNLIDWYAFLSYIIYNLYQSKITQLLVVKQLTGCGSLILDQQQDVTYSYLYFKLVVCHYK